MSCPIWVLYILWKEDMTKMPDWLTAQNGHIIIPFKQPTWNCLVDIFSQKYINFTTGEKIIKWTMRDKPCRCSSACRKFTRAYCKSTYMLEHSSWRLPTHFLSISTSSLNYFLAVVSFNPVVNNLDNLCKKV